MTQTLRTRILFILLIVLSLLGGTAYLIHSRVLLPSFVELERQHISAKIRHVINALENEQHHLSLLANDWSAWNDTYRYAIDHNPEYEASNLTASTFATNELNLLYILDSERRRIWGRAVGEDLETTLAVKQFDRSSFPGEFALLGYMSQPTPLDKQQTAGLLMTSAGPMLCVARPVLDSNGRGPAHGTLLMGRLIGQQMTRKISHLTGSTYDIKPVPRASSPAEMTLLGKDGAGHIFFRTEGETLSASVLLADLAGDAALEVTVHEERKILAQGLHALRVALTLLAVGASSALVLMLLMLQRSVLVPVNRLTRVILAHRRSQPLPDDLEMGACASREICLLTDEFKQLVENLDSKNTQLGEVNLVLIEEAKKLKQAEATLKNLDRLKSEFISTAAHELSTPVASIMGFTELLSDPEMLGPLNEEQRQEFLQEIYENSERLTKIVADILDISRIETGRGIPLEKTPASLSELLAKIVNRFQMRARHQIEVKIRPGTPETLEIDTHRVSQVMENLLSNAAKYSPQGSRISIFVEQDGNHCKVTVIDQGIGMTVEQRNRIFDKFYRADASDTAIGGLGLGMSIVKQIIEDHGGTICVDSSPGEGTRVYFTLPIRQPA